jgi:hypothetical protein
MAPYEIDHDQGDEYWQEGEDEADDFGGDVNDKDRYDDD